MEHNIQPGKRAHLFRFSTFLGIFQWDEPTKHVPFTAEPEIPEILTKWKAPIGAIKVGVSSLATIALVNSPFRYSILEIKSSPNTLSDYSKVLSSSREVQHVEKKKSITYFNCD